MTKKFKIILSSTGNPLSSSFPVIYEDWQDVLGWLAAPLRDGTSVTVEAFDEPEPVKDAADILLEVKAGTAFEWSNDGVARLVQAGGRYANPWGETLDIKEILRGVDAKEIRILK